MWAAILDKTKAGYLEGVVSIIINIGLFGIKMWAGIVSGSIALSADAWHSLSDSLSSVIVILGTKLASQKPDHKHPFGHGRWEQISAIFIGVLLSIIAYDFLKDSLLQFKSEVAANFGTLAIIVTCISILVKEALAQYAFYIYRKTGSLTIKADGWHHRTDALSSIVVLIGIFFSKYFWWIDSFLGFVISVMLFYAAFEIIKESINNLLGEKPSPQLIQQIEDLIYKAYPENVAPHHYHIHNYVSQKELTFHIKFDNNLDIYSSHKISTDIENQIFNEFNIVSTIHIEPRNFEHDTD
jgi:cation diffusion facilitator family transporter